MAGVGVVYDMKEKGRILLLSAVLIIVSFAVTIMVTMYSLSSALSKNEDDTAYYQAASIFELIDNRMDDSIAVARTLSKDKFLADILAKDSTMEEAQREAVLKEKLIRLNVGLGMDSVFVISDSSHIFYNTTGNHRLIDTNDERDKWYAADTGNGRDYALGVIDDPRDYNGVMLYASSPVRDANGMLLGSTGIVMNISVLQRLVQEAEENFSATVHIVDQSGKVRIATNPDMVGTDCEIDFATKPAKGLFHYGELEKENGEMEKFASHPIDGLGWYVVVRDGADVGKMAYGSLLGKNLIAALLLLVITLVLLKYVVLTDNKDEEMRASVDRLTGLYTKNYVKFILNGKNVLNTRLYRSMAILDVDRVRQVNDTDGRGAGDTALRSVSYMLRQLVGDKGVAFRWGGDEFVVLFKIHGQEAGALCEELRRRVEKETNVTVSIGVANLRPRDTMNAAVERANGGLEQVKAAGKNKVFMVK